MTDFLPPFRWLPAAVLALGLILSGCRKKADPEGGTAVPASTPVPTSTPAATTPAAGATTAPLAVPETAPFFSERFLPPDQRLQRRQERILQVLDTTATTTSAP